MAQQSRRLAPGQFLEATKAAANDPPPLPIRNRGPREERLIGLRHLEASGSTEDEMRRYASEFVITDPDKQANLDQWRDDPWGYTRDTLSNIPSNIVEINKGTPAIAKLVTDAPQEVAGMAMGKIADLVGKEAPTYSTSSLETLRDMPEAIWDDLVSSYSTPEGFATHVKDNPAGLMADIVGAGVTGRGVVPAVRAANKLSQNPSVAAAVVGGATLGTTFDLMEAFRNAAVAWTGARTRRSWDLFDAKQKAENAAIRNKPAREAAEAQLKARRAEAKEIIKAKVAQDEADAATAKAAEAAATAARKRIDDDAKVTARIMDQQQSRLASEAAEATRDIRIHQTNIDRIDKASSVSAMESAELKARFHARYATGMGESERATILSAVEESVTNRRAVLAREETARKSAAASRQQMADARVTANVTERQNTRVARERADEAARIRESARERDAESRQQMAEGRESARIMDQGQDRVARESDAASRQQMEDAGVTSDLTNRRNDRVARERADEAARIRESVLFPDGREALSPTAIETSSRLNEGMRRSVSQRFQQPSVEPPMIPSHGSSSIPAIVEPPMTASHVSSSNPARAALDEMIETRVTPLESNAGSVPITRVTGAEGAMIAKTITDIKSGARRILTTEEMKYPEIREAWELAQARRHGMTHAARPASATSADREAIIQIEAGKNRVGRR